MDGGARFDPGTPFGVPKSPFPPGMHWASLREMLHDLLNDLHRTWVQEHLLRPAPALGAAVLRSGAQLTQAFPLSFRGGVTSRCGVSVPAFRRDGLVAGVALEAGRDDAVSPHIQSRHFRLSHYIAHEPSSLFLTVAFDDAAGVTEISFHTLHSLAASRHVFLRFRSREFAGAVSAGAIDFDALERAVLSTVIGYSARQLGPCACKAPCCIACRGSQALIPCAVRGAPYENLEFGPFVWKMVDSTYADGVLVSANPVFVKMSRHFGVHSGTLNELVFWGIGERLRHQKPVVPSSLPAVEPAGEPSSDPSTVPSSAPSIEHSTARSTRASAAPPFAPLPHEDPREEPPADTRNINSALLEIDSLLFGRVPLSPLPCKQFSSVERAMGCPPEGSSSTDPGATDGHRAAADATNPVSLEDPKIDLQPGAGPVSRPRPILPAPWPIHRSSFFSGRQVFMAERVDKAELRKRKKREAAFRSNTKKKIQQGRV